MLSLFASCMEKDFGYKQNPVNVIVMAHKSVMQENLEDLKLLLTKEALCLYGNAKGIVHLKKQLLPKISKYALEANLLISKYLKKARFVGFWSYYTEEYKLSLLNKEKKNLIAEIIVGCDFGFDGVKSKKDLERPVNEYLQKSCRIQKIVGHEMNALLMNKSCQSFEVQPL